MARIPDGKKVLLAEDDRFSQRLAKMSLERMGLTDITIAENGNKALALVEGKKFDLIVSDWKMPGIDGFQFLTELRKLDPDIPFLMLTSVDDVKKVEEAIRAGVNGYCVKPYTPQDLQNKIKKILPI